MPVVVCIIGSMLEYRRRLCCVTDRCIMPLEAVLHRVAGGCIGLLLALHRAFGSCTISLETIGNKCSGQEKMIPDVC